MSDGQTDIYESSRNMMDPDEEGAASRANGLKRTANWYEHSTWEFRQWDAGWETMDRQLATCRSGSCG